MFKGKQINKLEESTELLSKNLAEHVIVVENNQKKLNEIEKLVKETKESLNEMSASRFDSISQEIREFNEKVGKSSSTLEKVEKDLGELDQVTSQISDLDTVMDEFKAEFKETQSVVTSIKDELSDEQNKGIGRDKDLGELIQVPSQISDLQKFMDGIQAEFKETQSVVSSIKDELIDEKNKVVGRDENLVKQEVILNEKSGQLDKADKELKESRALIGKLQAERDSYEKELTDAKTFRDRYYEELTRIQGEHKQLKIDSSDNFAYSSAVAKFLDSTIEGKIILELQKRSPQTFDELTDKLQETAVRIKQSLNTLRELEITQVNEENRTVSI